MLRLSFQASNPRLEWEMNLRKRAALWADGTLRILRLTWYADPAGQPSAHMPRSIFAAIQRMARWIAAMSSSIVARQCRLHRRARRYVGSAAGPDRGRGAQGRRAASASLLSGQGHRDRLLSALALTSRHRTCGARPLSAILARGHPGDGWRGVRGYGRSGIGAVARGGGSPQSASKLAAGGFSADVADIEAARLTTTMEEVQRIAAQRCGKMKVRFGRYQFRQPRRYDPQCHDDRKPAAQILLLRSRDRSLQTRSGGLEGERRRYGGGDRLCDALPPP